MLKRRKKKPTKSAVNPPSSLSPPLTERERNSQKMMNQTETGNRNNTSRFVSKPFKAPRPSSKHRSASSTMVGSIQQGNKRSSTSSNSGGRIKKKKTTQRKKTQQKQPEERVDMELDVVLDTFVIEGGANFEDVRTTTAVISRFPTFQTGAGER